MYIASTLLALLYGSTLTFCSLPGVSRLSDVCNMQAMPQLQGLPRMHSCNMACLEFGIAAVACHQR